ncbi:MAG: hypothetical protein HXX16_20135 [Bacteroidales bacterium]|nr:hypothetical protein [Bacteroidales bacterium]
MSRIILFLLLLGLNRIVIGQNISFQHKEFPNYEYDSISKLPGKAQETLNHILDSSYSNYKTYVQLIEIIPYDSGQEFELLKIKYLKKPDNKRFYIKYDLLIPGKGKRRLVQKYSFHIVVSSSGQLLKPIELPSNELEPNKILSYKQALRKTRWNWKNPFHHKQGFLTFDKDLNSFLWSFTSKIRRSDTNKKNDYMKEWLCQTIYIEAFTGKLTRNIKHRELEFSGIE